MNLGIEKLAIVLLNLFYFVFVLSLFFLPTTDKIYGVLSIVSFMIGLINLFISLRLNPENKWKSMLFFLGVFELILIFVLPFII